MAVWSCEKVYNGGVGTEAAYYGALNSVQWRTGVLKQRTMVVSSTKAAYNGGMALAGVSE
eukprot:1377108-Rhodomonas_salina.1